MSEPHLSKLVVQEGPVFHADTHNMPETAGSYAQRRRAACQIVLARDCERASCEYLNFQFGWWDGNGDGAFKRVRYMPSRWADEFIVALRRAQVHIDENEEELRIVLAAKLDERMREDDREWDF